MSRKFRLLFPSLLLLLQLALPSPAFAANCTNFNSFANPTVSYSPVSVGGTTYKTATASNLLQPHQVECVYQKFIGVIAPLAGLVAFVIIGYSGFKYVTAQGDQKAVASARNTLTMAIFGLILVIVSYFLLDILTLISGPNLRQFDVPKP